MHSESINGSPFRGRFKAQCSQWQTWTFLLAAGLMLLCSVGCGSQQGPQRAAVSGFITLNGTPLNLGIIRFIPHEEGGPGTAARVVDGGFEFSIDDGPVVASHRVEIEATDYQGFDIDDEIAYAKAVHKSGRSPMAINPVPPNYNRASKLTVQVSGTDEHVFRFDLVSTTR